MYLQVSTHISWAPLLSVRLVHLASDLGPMRIQTVLDAMQGRVSTWMGDCLRAGKPSRYITSRLRQLSLTSLRGR